MCIYRRWMDGWMNGWRDGWVDRCVYIDDGWMDGWVYRCVYIDDRLNRLNYSPSSSLEVCGIFDNALWENRKSDQKVK